jgi:uncharacterized protein YndB with AHSA1/START domain
MQWYCPKPWQVSKAELELRPGGKFNVTMQGPEGEIMDINGIYLEIVPMTRLIFTDAYREDFWPQPQSFMTGCVEMSDAGLNQTKIIWSARHANAEAVKQHLEMGFEAGWNASADQLAELATGL